MSHIGLYAVVGALLSSQTCEGNTAQLNCGSHVIKVLTANYGRTDKRVCAKGRPASQITKTNCVLPRAVNVMAGRCDGKSSCSVPATNNVFSDPCGGTYKYLQVTYNCVPKLSSQTCEGNTAQLNCGSHEIKVLTANYGRTDKRVCAKGRPASQITKTNCVLPRAVNVMAGRCDGKSSCSVPATNNVFSDPCGGTYKYLQVTYNCVPKLSSQTCEGNTAQLNCGSHVIKVLTANYGRTDKRVCAKGRPASQITKTNCVLPRAVNVMAGRCDGKSSCSVPAKNNVFSDPCGGTYKYLQVTYNCVPKRLSLTTCEHGKATLNCGSQQIKVLSANYGRTDKRTCAAGRPANQVTKTNCILPKTLSVMAKRCDGRTSCSLYATNTVFSDPCYGTFKYLKAHYMCLPPKKQVVACEGSTARLACGSNQVIRVDSANYGRHNKKTCSSGRPCNQISNTSCSRPSTKVADRCNGKRQCNFRAVNSEFGDPCYGTYKYLDVSYHCLP